MTTDDARLARVETEVKQLRDDVAARVRQEDRTRERLHNIEGTLKSIVELHKQAREQEARQYRKLTITVAVASAAIAFGMLALAVVVALTHHG